MIAELLLSAVLASQASAVAIPPPSLGECAACHEAEAGAFSTGPHGSRMPLQTLQQSCATCHEATTEHIENPSKETITRIPSDRACASCHRGSRGALQLGTPGHERDHVTCLGCHASGHAQTGAAALLQQQPRTLCASCHRAEAARFELPFAHRDERRLAMNCTECHSVHGPSRIDRFVSLDEGKACSGCHSDVVGPHVFEHPPRGVEGCASCHESHGSTNPRQLTRRTLVSLCLECHTNLPRSHDLTSPRWRSCTSCHTAIHGSNRDPRLFDR